MLSVSQMNYARFFCSEYFPDLHGVVLHIDDDCIVHGTTHIICSNCGHRRFIMQTTIARRCGIIIILCIFVNFTVGHRL